MNGSIIIVIMVQILISAFISLSCQFLYAATGQFLSWGGRGELLTPSVGFLSEHFIVETV